MTSLNIDDLQVEQSTLYQPPLVEVALVLEAALRNNYAEATVRVVDCPDLTEEPFSLAAKGLCGSPRLVEVGGVPFLIPLAQKQKIYNLWDVPAACGVPQGMLIGAGAGPWPYVGKNSEMVPNLSLNGTSRRNESYVISIEDKGMKQVKLPSEEARAAILCNAFISEGKPGKVFEVSCKKRTGDENLVSCLRKALLERYTDRPVGMGGAFLMGSGKAKLHVMPDFSETPLASSQDVDKWLHFYEVSAPLVCLSTFMSQDPGLAFRIEHTHCFSNHGEGGHYHGDVLPEKAEYRGYFNLAERAYRIDRPVQPEDSS